MNGTFALDGKVALVSGAARGMGRAIALAAARRAGAPRTRASPRARRLAAALGVDLAHVPASGRGGRIRERDVRAAIATERP